MLVCSVLVPVIVYAIVSVYRIRDYIPCVWLLVPFCMSASVYVSVHALLVRVYVFVTIYICQCTSTVTCVVIGGFCVSKCLFESLSMHRSVC